VIDYNSMKKKVNALCIVAHPDDETIWMGGTILNNQDWEWTIFSLCRKDDSDRMPKFKKVCEFYNARPIISDLDDETLDSLSLRKIVKKIKENLPKDKYEYIFTHGKNGEYGHIRHKETHKAVGYMIHKKYLRCENLYYFSYVTGDKCAPHDSKTKIPIADKRADLVVELDETTLEKKFLAITSLYGFKEGIFETLACGKIEAFKLFKK
jgi:LmbE family N-acetylglucosaminyl deacetylase